MFTSYHCTIKQCNTSTGTYIYCYYIKPQLVAYTNELSYLLEDDDNSTELVHAVYFVSQLMHIKYFVLYYYLFTQLLIASDVFMYV